MISFERNNTKEKLIWRVIVNYLSKVMLEKKVQTFHKCFVWRKLQVGTVFVCGPAS